MHIDKRYKSISKCVESANNGEKKKCYILAVILFTEVNIRDKNYLVLEICYKCITYS